ncbi:MAG: CoB--CoM heterodisulfide reductase iron-sulfur subunit A family protein [Chloroflexi bacterium]|nr:CoB--CoM heterodisulfide reductase iron-sulfur subunit A family protein [Chloroflexota bacterium]
MANNRVLIIGGGPAGLEAAHNVADLGLTAVLVEKRERLGGTPISAQYAALTHGFRDAEEAFDEMIARITQHTHVEMHLNSRVVGVEGKAGDFRVRVENHHGAHTMDVGAIIVATGFDHFDPARETQIYNYYEYPDVITIADLEPMLKAKQVVRRSNGALPERVCFIQCVGSRDRQIGNEYCSKVCCGIASKQAIEIKQLVPSCKVFIFYIDMRMYGYWENEIYWPAQEKYKVNYIKGIVTEVIQKGDKLLVRGEDTTMGRPMEVTMDLVVLSVGMEPSKGTKEVAQVLGLKQNKFGFIDVPHESLDPTATSIPGIFVAGAAAGPKDLDDTISMAGLASLRAITAARKSHSN